MNEKLELLVTTKECIEQILMNIEKSVEALRSGEESQGIVVFQKIIEDFDLTIQALNLTVEVQKEKIDSNELNNIFEETIQGIENGDFVLVADLMEYEIKPVLEAWKEKVELIGV